MAGFYSGKDGELYIGDSATPAGQIMSWNYSMSMAVMESSSLGDTDRVISPGLRSYSGSCKAFYYTTQAGGTSNVKELLEASIKPGTSNGDAQNAEASEIVLKLRYSEGTGNTNARDIKFSVYITQITMSSNVGEIATVDFTWEANGAPYSATSLIN